MERDTSPGRNEKLSVTIQNSALTSYQRSNMMMDPEAHQRVRGRALQALIKQADTNDYGNVPKRIHDEGRNFNNTQYKGKLYHD